MTTGREQHYIPKFYLKRFASEESLGHFSVYRLRDRTNIVKASIKQQAREKDFYGTEGLDDLLQEIEGQAASLLSMADTESALPQKGTLEYDYLIYFVASLKGRTRTAAKALSVAMGAGVKNMMLMDSSLRGIVDGLTVELTNPQKESTIAALRSANTARDLSCKILRTNGKIPFVTSDNPVLSYNQYSEYRKLDNGTAGFASKGLQMFLPIGPNAMLMFYDQRMYKVGSRKQVSISVIDPALKC